MGWCFPGDARSAPLHCGSFPAEVVHAWGLLGVYLIIRLFVQLVSLFCTFFNMYSGFLSGMLWVMPQHVLILLDFADVMDVLDEDVLLLDYDEEGLELDEPQRAPSLPYGATQGPGSTCPVCHFKFTKLRRHVVQQHLPWYLQPHTACWTCGRQPGQTLYSKVHQRDHDGSTDGEFGHGASHVTFVLLVNGYLQKLAIKLGYDDIVGLLDRAQSDETIWPPSAEGVQVSDKEAMSVYCRVNDLPESDCQIRPPSSLACLLHWRVQVGLLALLTEEQQQEVKASQCQEQLSFAVNLAVKREGLQGCNVLVDSHCHLKRWLQEARYKDLGELLRNTDFRGCNSPDAVVTRVVTNFIWPDHWPRSEERDGFREDGRVSMTFGVHPRVAAKLKPFQLERYIKDLDEKLLVARGVVGVGECGLDYTVSPVRAQEERRKQEEALLAQARLARKHSLPLVVHARDHGDGLAASRTLDLLKGELDQQHPVHRHCFSGSLDEYNAWVAAFPNSIYGMSPRVLFDADRGLVFASMELARTVVETDGPYLTMSSRSLALLVDKLACLHGVSQDVAQFATSEAVRKFYRVTVD